MKPYNMIKTMSCKHRNFITNKIIAKEKGQYNILSLCTFHISKMEKEVIPPNFTTGRNIYRLMQGRSRVRNYHSSCARNF